MNSTWQALAREAGTAADHLAIGVTAIGKANYAQNAYYSQAFFALSTGLERTAKLGLVIDYALENGGKFPSTKEVSQYRHNLRKLLNQLDEIAKRRGLTKPEDRLPSTSIHNGIIEVLSEFADSGVRYYNLDFVTGSSTLKDIRDPVWSWFEKVTKPVLNVHYKSHHKATVEENAKVVAELLEGSAKVFHHSEQGNPLDTIYDASVQTGLADFAKPYTRMYVMQITHFLAILMTELTYSANKAQKSDIPHLPDFFAIFNNSDNYFKKRKTWSIYHT